MRVLVVTNMYPSPRRISYGIFVKEQVESLRKKGLSIDVHFVPGYEGIKHYLLELPRLGRTLSRNQYDLIHAHYGLSAFLCLFQRTVPVVGTYHGGDLLPFCTVYNSMNRGKAKLIALLGKLASLRLTRAIVVWNKLQEHLWCGQAETLPMGVDLECFRPNTLRSSRAKLGLSQTSRLVLFAADPANQRKRFDLAMGATELLDGSELIRLTDQPHQTVASYMNACDVLVLPSMAEASPCVIREALASNLPIVASDVGDIAEQIHGVMGCYLCELNVTDIASKLRSVLKRGKPIQGRAKVLKYSLPEIAQKLVQIYEECLKHK